MKQSPYLAFSCPSNPNSSVCSMAMFKYPSKHANTPRYSTPEFNLTRTGRPNTDFRKSDGDRLLLEAVADASCGNLRKWNDSFCKTIAQMMHTDNPIFFPYNSNRKHWPLCHNTKHCVFGVVTYLIVNTFNRCFCWYGNRI